MEKYQATDRRPDESPMDYLRRLNEELVQHTHEQDAIKQKVTKGLVIGCAASSLVGLIAIGFLLYIVGHFIIKFW